MYYSEEERIVASLIGRGYNPSQILSAMCGNVITRSAVLDITQRFWAEVKTLRREGKSFEEISELTELTFYTVRNLLR